MTSHSRASVKRKTNETDITIELEINIPFSCKTVQDISTGIGFLDHVKIFAVLILNHSFTRCTMPLPSTPAGT